MSGGLQNPVKNTQFVLSPPGFLMCCCCSCCEYNLLSVVLRRTSSGEFVSGIQLLYLQLPVHLASHSPGAQDHEEADTDTSRYVDMACNEASVFFIGDWFSSWGPGVCTPLGPSVGSHWVFNVDEPFWQQVRSAGPRPKTPWRLLCGSVNSCAGCPGSSWDVFVLWGSKSLFPLLELHDLSEPQVYPMAGALVFKIGQRSPQSWALQSQWPCTHCLTPV